VQEAAGGRVAARLLLAGIVLWWAAVTADAADPRVLPPWAPGVLDIHHLSTGRGNATFFVFPDGTTLLFDIGDVGDQVPGADPVPDGSRSPGEWIVRYLRPLLVHREDPVLDYVVISHFHPDHLGWVDDRSPPAAGGWYRRSGVTEVGDEIPIRTMIDRGWPDYDYPKPIRGRTVANYRRFLDDHRHRDGMRVERLRVGRDDQIVPVLAPGGYPDFSIRNLAANGEVWTGSGTETRQMFPPLSTLPEEDWPTENMCSLALLVRYGPFDYYTGGDLPGIPDPGEPAFHDLETPIAQAIARVAGQVEVQVVDHHGSIDPASPFFLATLRPRVDIVPAWAPSHPAPVVLKRLLSERIYPGPRDVFILRFREPTKLVIGPRAEQVASDHGHVVVRVEPGGATFRVYVLDDEREGRYVLAVNGPYSSR
jgi:glyoxylase-like metal-dependent hydrolase (beta-lactamase superfamily II)